MRQFGFYRRADGNDNGAALCRLVAHLLHVGVVAVDMGFINVGDIHHRLHRQQEQFAQRFALFVAHRQGAGEVAVFQMRRKAGDDVQFQFGVFVAAFGDAHEALLCFF